MEDNRNKKSYLNIKKRFYFLLVPLLLFIAHQIYINQKTVNIDIIYSGDMVSNILADKITENVNGDYAFITTYTKNNRNSKLVLGAGNMFFPTPEANYNKGKNIVMFFSEFPYDAMNVGYNELKWGKENLRHLASMSVFPFLSCNIVDKTLKKSPYIMPYVIKNINSLKIGIIGLASQETLLMNRENDIKGLILLPIFQTLRKYIEILKEQEKVDIIILLSRFQTDANNDHSSSIDNLMIADQIKGIDIIISKSSSQELIDPFIASNKTIICQPDSTATNVAKLSLVIREKNNDIITFENQFIPIRKDKTDTGVNFSTNVVSDELYLDNNNTIIGKTNFSLFENLEAPSNLGNLITDIMRKETHADVALLENRDLGNGFSIGRISYRDLYNVFPNNYKIITESLSGQEIKAILEISLQDGGGSFLNISGMTFTLYKNKNNIKDIMINNVPINYQEFYKIALLERMLNSHIKTSIYRTAIDIEYTNFKIRDILIDYIHTHVPIEDKYKN